MSRGRPAILAAIAATSLAAAGCLTASQQNRLQTDMTQVREQVFDMQKDTAAMASKLDAIEQSLSRQQDMSPARFADLESILRTLTDEVRALGARIDDNTTRMTALSRDVTAAREQYRALEARLAAALATGGRPMPRGLPGVPGEEPVDEEADQDAILGDSGSAGGPTGNLNPAAPLTAGGTSDGMPPAPNGASQASGSLETDSRERAPEGMAPTAPPEPETQDEAGQEQAYRNAYNEFTRGSFDTALTGFQEFLRRYPASPLSGRAQYYIGECLFSQQRYDEAASAFTLVIENYAGSDKMAAAYLKKGLSLLALKQTARGVIQLQHVIETYPRSEEARIAADRLRQLGLRDR